MGGRVEQYYTTNNNNIGDSVGNTFTNGTAAAEEEKEN